MKPINLLSIGIASDHAGYELKSEIIKNLEQKGSIVYDFGTNSTDSVDYPDYAHLLADAVEKQDCNFGIAICGTGNGVNITVNHHKNIRGALCWNRDIASLARKHNDANIISLPARFMSVQEAIELVNVFLSTDFEEGRHKTRIDKIPLNN